MFQGEPEIIRTKLQMWESNGLRRYYYNRWDHYFQNGELFEYQKRYGIDPLDREVGIKVFFDDKGVLHINNCHDPDMKVFLEEKMKGWYRWACNQYDMQHSGGYKIMDLIEPYITTIRPGFYQVRYKDMFFNFDDSLLTHLKWAGYVEFNYRNGTYYVETEYPDFDRLIMAIVEDKKKDSEGRIEGFPLM